MNRKQEVHAKVTLSIMKDMDGMTPQEFDLDLALLNYIMDRHYDTSTNEVDVTALQVYLDDVIHNIRVTLWDLADKEVK